MRLPSDSLKINRQKLIESFPAELTAEVNSVADFLLNKNFDIHPTVEQEVFLNGFKLTIPGRVYFDEPIESLEDNLSPVQQTILNCLYLRHHNGYVRQKKLEQLAGKTDYFIIPFIFQLIGEYVVEILTEVYKQINEDTIAHYVMFVSENSKYWQQTESRMISYWNEYYRWPNNIKLKDYIGFHIIRKIKAGQKIENTSGE